jgi:hypothetical protein
VYYPTDDVWLWLSLLNHFTYVGYGGLVPERGELRELVTYALASCGSGDYNADVKKAVEVCVSAGKLSSAYMLLLYILNGGEIPRYHPIPLPYVTRIEDICVVNP